MDRTAISNTVQAWLAALVDADPNFAWLDGAILNTEPAFLTDAETKQGDDYKAGAVTVVITPGTAPTLTEVGTLHNVIVGDRTLGGRAKDARYEKPRGSGEAGTIVVIPL